MRPNQIEWCFAAVILLFLSAVANAQTAPDPATSDLALVVGDGYIIRSERHGAVQRFSGDLVKVNDRWLVLHSVGGGRRELAVPVLSKIPLVGSAFRKSEAAGGTDEYLWIPRDAATVEKRSPATSPPPGKAPVAEIPPVQTVCAIELAVGDKVVRQKGGLEVYKDEGLTLSVPKTVSVAKPNQFIGMKSIGGSRKEVRYDRQQHNRADILCVRIPNYDPATVAAPAP